MGRAMSASLPDHKSVLSIRESAVIILLGHILYDSIMLYEL